MGSMQWYAASGVAAVPVSRSGWSAHEGRRGDCGGVVAAIAVRDEIEKEKENLWVGQRRLDAPCMQSRSGRYGG